LADDDDLPVRIPARFAWRVVDDWTRMQQGLLQPPRLPLFARDPVQSVAALATVYQFRWFGLWKLGCAVIVAVGTAIEKLRRGASRPGT
jgi:hypothetical protein